LSNTSHTFQNISKPSDYGSYNGKQVKYFSAVCINLCLQMNQRYFVKQQHSYTDMKTYSLLWFSEYTCVCFNT